MIFQTLPCYVAEKNGNLQQLLDLFNHQRQYAEAYVSAIEPFSADSALEEWHYCLCGNLAGVETAHFYPFREKLLRVYQLGGLTTAQEMHDAYEQFHNYKAFLDGGMIVNDDGMVRAFSFFLSHISLMPCSICYLPQYTSITCTTHTTWSPPCLRHFAWRAQKLVVST